MSERLSAPLTDSPAYGWDPAVLDAGRLEIIQAHLAQWTAALRVRVELRATVQGDYSLSCAGNHSGQLAHWLTLLGAFVIGAAEYNRSDNFTAVYFILTAPPLLSPAHRP